MNVSFIRISLYLCNTTYNSHISMQPQYLIYKRDDEDKQTHASGYRVLKSMTLIIEPRLV